MVTIMVERFFFTYVDFYNFYLDCMNRDLYAKVSVDFIFSKLRRCFDFLKIAVFCLSLYDNRAVEVSAAVTYYRSIHESMFHRSGVHRVTHCDHRR